jgi:hypothetical protein
MQSGSGAQHSDLPMGDGDGGSSDIQRGREGGLEATVKQIAPSRPLATVEQ